MILGRGDATVFLTRPISATLLVLTVLVLVVVLMPSIRKKRDEVFVEGD
jgi:TctA family transporter